MANVGDGKGKIIVRVRLASNLAFGLDGCIFVFLSSAGLLEKNVAGLIFGDYMFSKGLLRSAFVALLK